MSFPAGWYDDPKDSTQQRYWDGGFWTDYRRPREGPPPYQGQFGQQDASGNPVGQQGFGPGLGQQGMGRDGYGPQSPQGQQGFGYAAQGQGPATPDGQPLSGWWKRVLARIIDAFIIFFITLPATGYFFYQYAQAALDYQQEAIRRGDSPFAMTLPPEVLKWLTPATLILLVLYALYDYIFLTRTGATPGKKAVGISVRLSEVAGPPPALAVLKRCGFYHGLGLLGAIPSIGTLFGFISLVDILWPLWDARKQALHDKVAGTNVVVGPQPPKQQG